MPDRLLRDVTPGGADPDGHVQELVEAESGKGTQGVRRAWQASDSAQVVLTSDASGVRISRDNGATPPAQVVVDGTAAGGQLAGTYPDPTLSTATLDLLMPPGSILPYGGAAAPAGWLLCDGSAQSTTTYARLFAVLGYAYGGAGSAFWLPDLRGRVPLGASGTHPRAQTGGAESVAGPAHTHPGTHSHGLNGHVHPSAGHAHTSAGHAHASAGHQHTSAAHQHNIDHDHGNAVGAAAATPAVNLNSILNGTGSSTSVPSANHVHPVDLPALGSTLTPSITPADVGSTTPADTGASLTLNTATDNTPLAASFPGTVATMPPFVTVAYIIRTGA